MQESELILNSDGSIYHLNLLPEDIAEKVILVGDPNRVSLVSDFFDSVEIRKEKREFVTHTGTYKGKRLSVISTGIGTDNVDIVLNELDALMNLDLALGCKKPDFTQMTFIRLGTSGGLLPDVGVDTVVMSTEALGFDSLFRFYAVHDQLEWHKSEELAWYSCPIPFDDYSAFSEMARPGKTATLPGFYGPQGRSLRLDLGVDIHELLRNQNVHNLEMETAGIYGLAHLLGHRALSLSAILANRALGQFSSQPQKVINRMIGDALEIICR